MSFEDDLLRLSLEEAVDLKFQMGRALHGSEWQGKRPILECHEELLDALAYLREELLGRTQAFDGDKLDESVLAEVYKTVFNAAHGVRGLIESSGAWPRGQDGPQKRVEESGG